VPIASLDTKPKELPEDFEIFVQAEFLVAGDHRGLFAHSLGNDLAVERVRVVWREIEKIERMTKGRPYTVGNCSKDLHFSFGGRRYERFETSLEIVWHDSVAVEEKAQR
jgi:hypothetical protein